MILDLLLEALAPLRCAGCDEPSRALFCDGCAISVERAVDSRRAVFDYGGAVEAAIHRYKFQSRSDLAPRLSAPLVRAVKAFDVDTIASVPLHPMRLVERGFDQAALLARPVAKARRLPYDPRLLRRVRNTPKQSKLARAERLSNVRGAFRCVSAIKGRKILLIDDVATTGATLSACAETLMEAGASLVVPFVLALRDDLDRKPR